MKTKGLRTILALALAHPELLIEIEGIAVIADA